MKAASDGVSSRSVPAISDASQIQKAGTTTATSAATAIPANVEPARADLAAAPFRLRTAPPSNSDTALYSHTELYLKSPRVARERGPGEDREPDRERDQGDDRGRDEQALDRIAAVVPGPKRGVSHAPVPARALL